jgi:hypothetical protein
MKLRFLALLVSATVLASASSYDDILAAQKKAAPVFEKAISEADSVTLVVVDPHSRYKEKKSGEKSLQVDDMDGSWTVVKEAVLRDKSRLAELGSSLRAGIEKNDRGPASCFLPRHALRVKIEGHDVVLLVCFECAQGYAIGYPKCDGFLVSPAPAQTWNRVFSQLGLEIIP